MKNTSGALLAHMQGSAQTMCGLLRIGPMASGNYMGFTSLDRNVTYDAADGVGEITYYANTGFQSENLSSTSDLGVDNTTADTLTPIFPNTNGITVEDIDRGELDTVTYEVFVVSYEDLSMGHLHWASGVLGEQIITRGGLVRLELRSWSQLMKQKSVVAYYSITCRADFGSQPIGTGGPAREERFPCNYDAESEWTDFVVTGVGTETVREFTIDSNSSSALEFIDDYYAPGLLEFETGDNAGQSREIESFFDTGETTLLMTTRNPVEVGDTGRIRRSCSKRWVGHNSCLTYDNRQWFRGEPFIPVGDSLALNVPGVAGGGLNNPGSGEAP